MASTSDEWPVVDGVIMAAGLGRRMGSPKLLLSWREQPLIRHVAEVALASRLNEVLVVTGSNAHEVVAALAGLSLRIVHNPQYEQGLSTSLRAGIDALDVRTSAAMILLADQPLVTVSLIDRLIETYWMTHAKIVVPVAGGRRGNPVLFDRELFPELLGLQGDAGARKVIEAHWLELRRIEVEASTFYDVDTPEDYARLAGVSGRLLADADSGTETLPEAASAGK